jgi:hypothetical protein
LVEVIMIEFSCDWCSRIKKPQEAWILGIAAETVGYTAVRREATILSDWDRERAVRPLAVHFCSTECKDKYMAQLFDGRTPAEEEVIVERVEPAEVIKRNTSRQGRVTRIDSHRVRQHRRTALR